MVGCSIQNIRAITTQIESSLCKLVEQRLIYFIFILCFISVRCHILFKETVSKSNFTLTLLYTYVDALLYFKLLNRL